MMRPRSVVLFGTGAIILAAVAYVGLSGETQQSEVYRSAKVERGNVRKSVSASGELNAVTTVDVGSEISGQVSKLFADFNSEVQANQVIARIDPQSFDARVSQSEAELEVSKATLAVKTAAIQQAIANHENARSSLKAEQADLEKAKVTAKDLELDFNRKRRLRERGVVAVSAVDKARAAWEASVQQIKAAEARLNAQRSTVAARRAQVRMARAEVLHGKALVQKQKAALNFSKVDLENTYIRSPVDGVIIGRDVDVGQTVAASLQSPVLFTIAKDLRKMQVETNIDEADIGQIRPGQAAVFTVDSFPGREFNGTVTQVRKKPQNVQNVVTYTVVITADNRDLRLLPGMTANVQVKVSDRPGVLRIPNSALRFNPPGATPLTTVQGRGGKAGGGAKGGGKRKGGKAAARRRAQAQLARLTRQLDLSDEQKQQVQEFNRGIFRRIRALRQGGARGPDFRETITQLRRQASQQIMEALNPEQQVKYRAILAQRQSNPVTRARVWVLEEGRPKPVIVFIGVGDGKFTEMVRGGLTEGQQIITSINQTAQQRQTGFRRFGF